MYNKVILIGRHTKNPELKSTPQGTSVCTFTLAVDRRFQDQTDFFNCVAWKATAEFISKYFKKGDPICVEGCLQTRSWTGQDGQKRYVTEVMVDSCFFTGAKREEKPAEADPMDDLPDSFDTTTTAPDDDFPF